MATRGRREAEFVVDVEVINASSVKNLAKDVRSLAADGSAAAPEFEKLAQEIEKIGQQGDAVQVLQKLQAETDQLKESTLTAATAEASLTEKLAASIKATEAAQTAFRAAQEAQDTLTAKRNAAARALATLRAETDAADKSEQAFVAQQRAARLEIISLNEKLEVATNARRAAKQVVVEATQAENGYSSQLNRLAAETTKSNAAFRERAAALTEAQVAAGRLGVDTQNLAAEQVRLATGLQGATTAAQALANEQAQLAVEEQAAAYAAKQFEEAVRLADKAMAEQIATLAKTEAAMDRYAQAQLEAASAGERDVAANEQRIAAAQALIRSDEQLSVAQRELANSRNLERAANLQQAQAQVQAASAARESLAATQQLVNEAKSAANVLSDAFGKVGVRSLQALEAEIHETETALSLLERKFKSGAISALDLERATGGATLRLAQLQAEAVRIPSAPGVFERISSQITGLANRFGALSAAVATFGIALRPIIESEIELQRLNRVLNTVTGSSQQTAKTIEFLRNVSQASGQSFSELSGSFSKFAASAVSAGIPLQTVQNVFRSAANAAGNLGLETAATGRILTALGQIASKGTVQMEELKGQLGESLPGALALTAKSLGLTTQELTKLIESGGLTANVAIPAIGRAMDQLASKTGQVDGLTASWNRFTNVLNEAGTKLTEGPIGRVFGTLLSGISAGIQDIVVKASTASSVAQGVVQAAVGSLTAVVHGDFKGALNEISVAIEGTKKDIDGLKNRVGGIGTASAGAVTGTQALKTALDATALAAQTSGTAFASNVTVINSVANASNLLATAQKSASVAIADAATNVQLGQQHWARAAVDYTNAANAATLAAQVADRLVQAKRAEGEAMITVAELSGNEVAIQTARAQAATATAAAIRTQAEADQALVTVYTAERDALVELIQKTGEMDAGQEQQLKKLNETIAAKTADAEQTKQQAAAAERQAAALQLSTQALQDNSKSLEQFTKAAVSAREEYLRVSAAFADGRATIEQLTTAQIELAKAQGLVTDALKDSVAAAKAKVQITQVDSQVTLALLNVTKQHLETEIQMLEGMGRTYEATQKKIELKELEIKIIRATIEAKLAEVKATQAEIEAERQALEATGALTAAKKLELDARIKALEVKKLEAEAAKQQISLIEQQISNLRLYGSETVKAYGSATNSINKQTDAIESNTEAWTRNAAARTHGGQNVDANGFATDSAGNTVNAAGADANYVISQLKNAGMSEQQAYAAARAKGIIDANGGVHLAGYGSIAEAVAALTKNQPTSGLLLPEGYTAPAGQMGGGGGSSDGSSSLIGGNGRGRGTPVGGAGVSPFAGKQTTKTIVVDRGKKYEVTTDDESASTLESLIKNLSEASERSAG